MKKFLFFASMLSLFAAVGCGSSERDEKMHDFDKQEAIERIEDSDPGELEMDDGEIQLDD